MANKVQIQHWIDDYGEDSDFVRVRVRGEFPRAATLQLISEEIVERAQAAFVRRHGGNVAKALADGPGGLKQYVLDENRWAPRVLIVDVARFGGDQSVIGMRQGKCFVVLKKYRELTIPQVAYHVHEWIEGEEPDHVIVDGVGLGAGVVDLLREMGHEVIDANAGMTALEPRRFFNRRAEMWWRAKAWLEGGGMIPVDPELKDDLTGPEYGFSDRGERVQIESKEDMKARGLPSPDTADALVMSFWQDFAPVEKLGEQTMAAKLAAATAAPDGLSWKSR